MKKSYIENAKDSRLTYNIIGRYKYFGWALISLLGSGIFFISMVIGIMSIMVFLMVYDFIAGDDMPNTSLISDIYSRYSDPIHIFVTTSLCILAFFILIHFIEKRSFKGIGLVHRKRILMYLQGGIIAIIVQLVFWGILIWSGHATVNHTSSMAVNGLGYDGLDVVIGCLIAFAIQGASEEIMIRGWLMPVLARYLHIGWAVILSSSVFAFLHLLNPSVSFIAMFNLFLYGLFAALYALNENSLWGIFAFHSIWNWFMGNVLGFPVSGLLIGKASIFYTRVHGPSWLTGGDFGPEGSLIMSLFLAMGCIYLFRRIIAKELMNS